MLVEHGERKESRNKERERDGIERNIVMSRKREEVEGTEINGVMKIRERVSRVEGNKIKLK